MQQNNVYHKISWYGTDKHKLDKETLDKKDVTN
jgi:hypothetical protein